MVSEKDIVEYLKRNLSENLMEVNVPRERRVSARIRHSTLRRAIELLKMRYDSLRFITLSVVDHGLDFEYLYHFHIDGIVLTLRSVTPKETNLLESIVDIIPAASFIEREAADLFGLKMINHPEPKPLILTEDWPADQRPLRKPLKGDLPPQARPVAEAFISTSCVAPISTFIQRRREAAGLPRSPPMAFTDEKALQEFHGIVKATNLAEKSGFDWEKKQLRYK